MQDEKKGEAQKELGGTGSFSERYDKTVDQIQNLQRLQKVKNAEQKQMRLQLGGHMADQKDYLKQLEIDIK